MEDETVRTTSDVWNKMGEDYHPASVAMQARVVDPGIYEVQVNARGDWWLHQTATKFTFPYKVYGNNDGIITRALKAWSKTEGNLGILLNGLKGTGKTVTAQMLANALIEQGMPVLVVGGPTMQLGEILRRMEQPMLVIFDEFEKTHHEKESQQALLTTLDGMARTKFKRFFLFTTNEPKLEENFTDRPSRIRYVWEFGRLDKNILEFMVDDMLEPHLQHLRDNVLAYLDTRKVCSVDSVKATLQEVNMFEQPPSEFGKILNLSERDIFGFLITILNEDGTETEFATGFLPKDSKVALLQGLLTKQGRDEWAENTQKRGLNTLIEGKYGYSQLRLLRPGNSPNEWVVNLALDARLTWFGKKQAVINALDGYHVWLDEMPTDWEIPQWFKQVGSKDADDYYSQMREFAGTETLYGTGAMAEFVVRIEVEFGNSYYTSVTPMTEVRY